MDVASFSDIEKEFMDRVARIVWCTVTTVDTQDRPRARLLHPIWEGSTRLDRHRPQQSQGQAHRAQSVCLA